MITQPRTRPVAANLPSSKGARLGLVDDGHQLVVSPRDKLDEPDSWLRLGAVVNAGTPRVDLPEVFLARTEVYVNQIRT